MDTALTSLIGELVSPKSYLHEALYDSVLLSALCVAWFYAYSGLLVLPFLSKDDNRQRRLAWVLTLLSAIVGSAAGTVQLLRVAQHGWQPEVVTGSPREWRFVTHFFMVYFVWDWILSFKYYPSFFDGLTGYAHHVFYFFAGIGFLYFENTTPFMMGLIMEYSSFFMSIGSCHPHLRSDMAFGATFFCVRVVYHVFLVYRFFVMPHPVWMLGAAPLPVHLLWFKNWCSSYLLGGKKKQQLEAAKQANGATNGATNGVEKEKLQ